MIRQAISCDICGREMQNPNHWFVVHDRGAEFRMSPWDSRTRLRPDARHLCGQTCLHKLVDEYMARSIEDRASTLSEKPQPTKDAPASVLNRRERSIASTGAYTTSARYMAPVPNTYHDEYESSARLVVSAQPMSKPNSGGPIEAPTDNSHSSHAGAWQRERARERAFQRRSIA